jgi:hypothetical protein
MLSPGKSLTIFTELTERAVLAGAIGEAILFVSSERFKNLCVIENRFGEFITRKEIDGFQPQLAVPASDASHAPKKAQKSGRRNPRRKPSKSRS